MNSTQELFFTSVTFVREVIPGRYQIYNVCVDEPKIVSDGIWANRTTGALPTHSTFTMLELQILIIFVITQIFHFSFKRLGLPYFISQVMTGFLLGPSIPTGPMEKYKKMLFPYGSPDILNTISSFGFSMFLFLNAVQMDFTLITRTGKKAWVIALSTLITPMAVGFFLTKTFFPLWVRIIGPEEAETLPVTFISHCGGSFAVIASLLSDLGILNSELGRLALSAAFLNDISGAVVAGLGTAIVSSQGLYLPIINVGYFLAFLITVPLIGRPAMRWVVKKTPEGRPVNKIYINIIILVLLLLGLVAGYFHQPFLVGALVFGLAVPEGPPLGSELVYQLELFSTWFLLPIFVTSCTMKVDLTQCGPLSLVLVMSSFIIMVHSIKFMLCSGICRYCKMPYSDGLCLALILSCKGVVDHCTFILVYDGLKQTPHAIGVMTISVLIVGTISRFGVKSLYDPKRKYAGYQKRDIMNLKKNSELRVVACIHKRSHINQIKNVLELCTPAPDNALVADVLHLMELVGRTTPVFIAHRLQQRGRSTRNYSEELNVVFDLFEREYAGSATANTYTAISPVTLMHEDVTQLALDKLASLIILPFHIRWAEDGSIESEDTRIRSLNSNVLERAPCSIGILVNRGSSSFNLTSYKVAMIFLGGPDDREALCLAKRFAKNSDNRLFVYRLLAHDNDSIDWETMIDDEELREVRGAYIKLENVTYEEIIIQDASQTTTFLKDMANKFDFIVVGRRNGVQSPQTLGLEDWTEFTELGVIGDLLASQDMETKASILVVQQQQTTSLS
ncbi:cation/H(+) antiporter 4-like [Gastrolobium bilobum]|uniref:cation/H(+) antiporter 4-like n=1 Tax=Gastrolobium bilobum TaxID=150636 RepID=UPI002AB19A15|nr:cation/H(+) antiporter 4-like [Gastrolobium bilobum]